MDGEQNMRPLQPVGRAQYQRCYNVAANILESALRTVSGTTSHLSDSTDPLSWVWVKVMVRFRVSPTPSHGL